MQKSGVWQGDVVVCAGSAWALDVHESDPGQVCASREWTFLPLGFPNGHERGIAAPVGPQRPWYMCKVRKVFNVWEAVQRMKCVPNVSVVKTCGKLRPFPVFLFASPFLFCSYLTSSLTSSYSSFSLLPFSFHTFGPSPGIRHHHFNPLLLVSRTSSWVKPC